MAASIKVACLYRVSTKKQVDDNDIPMQKNACREFICKMPDWELVNEYSEKGVSGYHKSEEQRDVLRQVKLDASKGNFNVLLVFMFDRLGRREDETPFIVEWFVAQNIQVWSVKEGQQKFENRVDKLMNYIRFWQSGGESEKTSIRVAEKHKQMVEEGRYRGGSAPYGYKLIKSGEENNKGYELKKLVIDEAESEVIKTVFNLATVHGYGVYKISKHLNDRNIKTKRGNSWTSHSVMTLLKNPLYKGCYVAGKIKNGRGTRTVNTPDQWIYANETLDELIIIEETVWNKAEEIRNSRHDNTEKFPKQTKGPLLFIGFAKCGYCGETLTSTYAVKKWTRKKDNEQFSYLQPKYLCQKRSARVVCTGQHSYSVNKVDPVLMIEIYHYLDRLKEIDLSQKIDDMQNNVVKSNEVQLLEIQEKIEKTEKELDILNDEIMRCITGESKFSSEQLAKIIGKKETELKGAVLSAVKLSDELKNKLIEVDDFVELQKMIPIWKTEFEAAPIEVKKMLLAQIVDKVFVFKDKVDIYFKFDLFKLAGTGGENI